MGKEERGGKAGKDVTDVIVGQGVVGLDGIDRGTAGRMRTLICMDGDRIRGQAWGAFGGGKYWMRLGVF